MTGKAFTSYLTEEGITNILQRRKDRGETGKPARERYSKHVKALVQVGNREPTTTRRCSATQRKSSR